jgi:prolyl-tRNA editing enzyme YbaK/EbsC (Cys-tRNA(Pro) deacylase)
MSAAYDLSMELGANCVVVGGSRGGEDRVAACMVRADTRADVNNVVRRILDVRKASFLPMDRAVEESGMEYGGITPVGLPPAWRVLVDPRVLDIEVAVIGSGVRRSKLLLQGRLLGELPGAEVVEGLASLTRGQ